MTAMTGDDITRLVDRPYSVKVVLEVDDEGDRFYLANHPELPGCMAQGDSRDAAVASLREARALYLQSVVRRGLSVPEPRVITAVPATAPAPDAYEAHLADPMPRVEVRELAQAA
jgi:predicted RNase H-like HicB family nuclease